MKIGDLVLINSDPFNGQVGVVTQIEPSLCAGEIIYFVYSAACEDLCWFYKKELKVIK